MARINALKSGVVLATLLAIPVLANGCSAANTIEGAAQGCNAFPSSVSTLKLDANTQAFVAAAASLVNTTNAMEQSVLTACANIATGLGVTDSWTSQGPSSSGGSLDNEVNAACTAAAGAITAALGTTDDAGVAASAECGLNISGGQCTVNASAEASCTGGCTGAANCTPPTITPATCTGGQITGQCSGNCNASATCEGSVTAQATCTGSCSAQCTGECDATATAPSIQCAGTCSGTCQGTCSTGSASGTACSGTCTGQCTGNCTAIPGSASVHCGGTCQGSCSGNCVLAANANVNCGANVNCTGGCSVAYTAPSCEGGQVTPPMCGASANCQASCQSQASLSATCTPPQATFQCSATASGSLATLVTLVQTNFPALILAAQTQGPLAVQAAGTLFTTGSAVVANITSVGGQALACASAAATASASAQVSVGVSVKASASVTASAGAS